MKCKTEGFYDMWGENRYYEGRRFYMKGEEFVGHAYYSFVPSLEYPPIPELEPCPYCNKDSGTSYAYFGDDDMWRYRCTHCDYSSPRAKTRPMAFKLWNKFSRLITRGAL